LMLYLSVVLSNLFELELTETVHRNEGKMIFQ